MFPLMAALMRGGRGLSARGRKTPGFSISSLVQALLSGRAWRMDASFLEFWGNLLISIARGQKQLDDMRRWVQHGFPGADDLTNLFGKAYGWNQFPQKPTARGELSKETFDRFRQSYRGYLELLDVVPRTEYDKLQQENKSLQRKIVELEAVVGNLRAFLAEKIQGAPGAAMDEFQRTFLKYLENVQQLMISFADVSKSASAKETGQSVDAESDKG
jgi:uncharacterized protein YukE